METLEKVERKMRGTVTLIRRNVDTGETIIVGENLVVNNAYVQLAQLLGKVAGIVNPVANIILGIGGAVPPSVSDTGITGPVVTLPVTVSYPYAYTVRFTASWSSTLSDPAEINEAGLFFQDNSLCARYCFGKMIKSLNWEWTISWELAYSV